MMAEKSGEQSELFAPEPPWPAPELGDCYFYHSLDFPDGTSIQGCWDIRGRFDEYIGRYPLAGKTVLDVGTATGFLAFSAEAAGARVTALDARDSGQFERIPFSDSLYHRDRSAWIKDFEATSHRPLRNGFWHAWHRLQSKVEVIYASAGKLHSWDRRFDVVLAGAIIEHLADPVSAIGNMARLANEAVIIAFTDVHDSEELIMRANGDWSNPACDYEWWALSRGLYCQVLKNLGFEMEITACTALCNPNPFNDLSAPQEVTRPTIIARRVKVKPPTGVSP
ncbi:MAG TPA: methyltransferase domain-containing protein [Chthoniobacterales bacterium]|nr:methyltransferase domain-containing protein [Chthoniobacterales bacterium]